MNASDRVGDRYVLRRLVGKGGMGEVWEASDERLGVLAAIKFLNASDGDFRDRFRREAQALARIQHGNVVAVLDYDADHEPPYLVMRMVDGTPLDRIPRPMDPTVVRRLVQQVASGLEAAHQLGIVHRDIKPSNLLIDGRGDLTIIDFGLVTHTATGTLSAASMGTPEYWAPEQASGGQLDGRTDIYATGVVAYEMLTGQLPYPVEPGGDRIAASLRRTVTDATPVGLSTPPGQVDPALNALVDDMLRRDPAQRPTATAVINRIADAQPPVPSEAPPATAESTTRSSNRPLIIGGIAAAALVFVVAAIAGLALRDSPDSAPALAATTEAQTTSAAQSAPVTGEEAVAEEPEQPNTADEPVDPGITGLFGSFDLFQQCRGGGDFVTCYSTKSGHVVRLSLERGVEFLGTRPTRPWTGDDTRAVPMGQAVPARSLTSPINCLSSERGITCAFDPEVRFLGAGTSSSGGTFEECDPGLENEYFVIGDAYVRLCDDGVESRIE